MQKNNGNSRLSTGRVFRSITSAAAAAAVAVTTIAGVFPAMPADAQAAGRDEAEVVLRVCNWEDESIVYYTFNDVNLANFMEIKDGKVTGNVIIHICDGLQFKTQAEYEAETGV